MKKHHDENETMLKETTEMDTYFKDEKKKQQQMYRNILDSQVTYNKDLKKYGNMTSVEKKMNKQDLKAFKSFDSRQYSLIAGVQ